MRIQVPILWAVTSIILITSTPITFAQPAPTPPPSSGGNQFSLIKSGIGGTECDFASGNVTAKCVPLFLAEVIKFIFGITGAICLIMIIIAGYQWVLGNVIGQDTGGKETLKWAIIGFIVSALSLFIIDFVVSTLSGNRGPPPVPGATSGATTGGGGATSGGGNTGS